ncbi:MAG: hypothetical protein AAGA48_25795 [Myxococcota bacterium]
MIQRTQLLSSLAVVGLVMAACRPTPDGPPVYPEYEPFRAADELLGPFPFEEGDARLSFEVFYEGQFSDIIPIDGTTTNYFIYEGTYTQEPSADRIEGAESAAITKTDAQPWWGGGVVWTAPTDLSEWTTLHVSFKSLEPLFETMDVLIEGPAGVSSRVKPADYGFVADNEWHSLVIPLEDFPAPDFTQIVVPVSFIADTGATGSTLLIDDVYYTQE